MPDKEKHERMCRLILGNAYTEVHEWLDESNEKGKKIRTHRPEEVAAEASSRYSNYEEALGFFKAGILHLLQDHVIFDLDWDEEQFKGTWHKEHCHGLPYKTG